MRFNKTVNIHKKGFMLADTMLSIVIIGITTASLLMFFNSLQNMDKSTANHATIAINTLHNKIQLINHEAIGGSGSGIELGADWLDASTGFSLFYDDKKQILKIFGDTPEYSLANGLKIGFRTDTFPCPRFLLGDMGFSLISVDGFVWDYKHGVIKNIEDSVSYCDGLTITDNIKNIYFKD